MKRGMVFAVVFCMFFSLCYGMDMPVLAADGGFQKVTLSLNSNTSDSASIDLYLRDSVHYITINDLCTLARCTQSAEGSRLSVAQGIRRVELDPQNQRFEDGCQEGELLIPEVSEGEYAVPALLFLSYFKAAAFIMDETLYCRMPQFTAWEALDTEQECRPSFFLDGGRRADGFAESIREAGIRALYRDLHSEKGEAFIEALGDTFSIQEEPEEWYIRFYFNILEEPFPALAFGACEMGESGGYGLEEASDRKRFGAGFYEAFLQKYQMKPENVDRRLLLAAAAVEASQLMKTVKAADALALEKKGTSGVGALQLEMKTREFFTGDACREALASADVFGTEEIVRSLDAFLEDALRWFEEEFSLCGSGVNALKDEFSVPELKKLCGQAEQRAQELLAEIQEQRETPELYGSYIQERQTYCRAAIALCEEQLAGWTEDSCAWDYQTVSLRNRIEELKLSLYRLTRFQEDGMDDCLPLDVAFFPDQPEQPTVNLYTVWKRHLQTSGEEEAYFLPADYDGDGRKEAFGFTGIFDGQKGYDEVKIYYLSSVGEVVCIRSQTKYGDPLYGYLLAQPVGDTEEGENYFLSASGDRLLVWEISAYGSGSSSVILGVKDGKAHESAISEQYMTFRQTGPDQFTGLISDFSQGFHAYMEQQFFYIRSTGEFQPAG